MKKVLFQSLVMDAVKKITTPSHQYSLEPIPSEALTLPAVKGIRKIYNNLMATHKGGSFHYVTALWYQLYLQGLSDDIAIVTTTNSNGGEDFSLALLYLDNANLFVCDIGSYIYGNCALEDCIAIPYIDFRMRVGRPNVFTFSEIDFYPYLFMLHSSVGNVTIDEFLVNCRQRCILPFFPQYSLET